ncbi:MAG: laccase domain-containing protein, partial [Brooklawnia sp.]
MFDTLIDPADNGGVGIAFTDRQGGVSIAAQASLNLGRSDVDQYSHLRTNMARVRAVTGIGPVAALHQVHGVAVHNADEDG